MEHRDVKLRCPRRDGSRACNRVIGVAWVRPDGSIDTILSGPKGGPGLRYDETPSGGMELLPGGELGGKPTTFTLLLCERHGPVPITDIEIPPHP